MSDTRPGEHARIKAIAGDDPRWIEALTSIALLLERSEQHTEWMRTHDNNDTAKFAAGDARMAKIEAEIGGAKSEVNDIQINSRYTLKEMVGGFLILCGALGSLIGFILWTIGNAGKGAP